MKRLTVIALAGALGIILTGFAGGKTRISVGVNASEWSSGTVLDAVAGIFPVGGSGQLNGEFTIAERDGIQIGLRATDRKDGLLTVSGRRKGRYEAPIGSEPRGPSDPRLVAEWNYDWHVDLRGAAAGTELGDFDLILNQTFAPSLFGFPNPVDLTFGGFVPNHTVLFHRP